jgi:hypothetical protein
LLVRSGKAKASHAWFSSAWAWPTGKGDGQMGAGASDREGVRYSPISKGILPGVCCAREQARCIISSGYVVVSRLP